jgi:hypothetical protein
MFLRQWIIPSPQGIDIIELELMVLLVEVQEDDGLPAFRVAYSHGMEFLNSRTS